MNSEYQTPPPAPDHQPGHSRSLISAFVICLLESKISKPASCKILIFHLVSVSEQVGKG